MLAVSEAVTQDDDEDSCFLFLYGNAQQAVENLAMIPGFLLWAARADRS